MINRIKNSIRVRGLRFFNLILGYSKTPELINIGIESFGNDYGCGYAPKGMINEKSVVIAVGAGEDNTCEVDMVKTYGCNVDIYDPTPRAIAHFDQLVENTKNGVKTLVNNDTKQIYNISDAEVGKLHFHSLGLWNEDTQISFFSPEIEDHVSHSIMQENMSDKSITVEVKCLGTIMKMLEVDEIDYLKIDIEGAEYEVLDEIVSKRYNVKSLYIEFYLLDSDPLLSKARINKYLKKMINVGYIPVESPEAHELRYLFVRKDLLKQGIVK